MLTVAEPAPALAMLAGNPFHPLRDAAILTRMI
jgi:hypothetical protein